MAFGEEVATGFIGWLASETWWVRGFIGGAIGGLLFVAVPPFFKQEESSKNKAPAATAGPGGVAIVGNGNSVVLSGSQPSSLADGIYIDGDVTFPPDKVLEDGRVSTMEFNDRTTYLQLTTLVPSVGSDWSKALSPQGRPKLLRCLVTNYNSVPLVDVEVSIDVTFSNPVFRTGQSSTPGETSSKALYTATIPRLDPGKPNSFFFYAYNGSDKWVTLSFRDKAKVKRIGSLNDEEARVTFPPELRLFLEPKPRG